MTTAPKFSPNDNYASLVNHGVGGKVAKLLGLPRPAALLRYDGTNEFNQGTALVIGTDNVAENIAQTWLSWGFDVRRSDDGTTSFNHVAISATGCRDVDAFSTQMLALAGTLKRIGRNGRILFIAGETAGETAYDDTAAAWSAVQAATVGAMRALAHEVRAGTTANAIVLAHDAQQQLKTTAAPTFTAALRFFSSTRSAFVNGQPLTIAAAGVTQVAADAANYGRPLAGQVAVVTGAARGIGAAIAKTLHRDGATIIAVDVPAAGDSLAALANSVAGTALQLDVTAPDAGARILAHAQQRHGRLDIVVHNAGITRDKLLANMDEPRWNSVLSVNLKSQLAINAALLASETFTVAPRIVSLASTSAIAGNRGQTNYAASKAGVMANVAHLSNELKLRGGTANAVAPGFIETDMTAKIPFATREVARRLSSLGQGGLPQDVAEAISFLTWPQAVGIQGITLRVCGQNLVGA